MKVDFRQFTEASDAHYNLLLDADLSKEMIDSYLKRSSCIEVMLEEKLVGVIVVLPTRPETIEIVNIAVSLDFQGKGIGQQMIRFVLEKASDHGIKTVEIGTGSTSLGQLYLYQKCDFRIVGIDTDFFVRHYPHEIIENGLVLKDMIRLSIDIDGT